MNKIGKNKMTLTFIENTNVQNMLPLSHLSQRSWELAISLACSPLLHLPDMLQVTPIFGRIFIRTGLLKKKKNPSGPAPSIMRAFVT